VPYTLPRVPPDEQAARAQAFYTEMAGRRTVRAFASMAEAAVPRAVIEDAIRTASTAPSGAHKQPWTYVVVENAAVRHRLRQAAEQEERAFYGGRAPQEWLDDLAPLGTDVDKPHLTDAPWLVVVFAQDYAMRADGSKGKHYYVNESVGISVGFFLAALRRAGVAALTHTPSPMNFLRDALGRPANERAYVVIPIGFPAQGAQVPDLARKPLEAVSAWV